MLLLAGCGTTSSTDDVAARLDRLFDDLHDRNLFTGAAVVGNERGILWERGYGYANIDSRTPFTPDTPSDSASLAKTITAAVVLSLAREGVVDLDAPVQRLLPELPYREITLRHLLSHSSGLPILDYDYFDRFLPATQIRTTEVLLRVISEQRPPLFFSPGSGFEYSSLGYDLAALAAARATGKPLPTLLHDRVFGPLGLTSAFLRPGRLADFPGTRTLGYRHADGQWTVNDVFENEAFHGGSNIYMSVRDFHRWNMSQMREDSAPLATIGNGQSGLTLGSWYESEDGMQASYAGHLQGFHNEVFRDTRTGVSIVYVSNNTMAPWLQHALVRAINTIVGGGAVEPLSPPATDAVAKEDRASLAGTWRLPNGQSLTVQSTPALLSVALRGVRYRMVQVDPRWFYVPGLDFMLGFAKDPEGLRLYLSSNFEELWLRRDPQTAVPS